MISQTSNKNQQNQTRANRYSYNNYSEPPFIVKKKLSICISEGKTSKDSFFINYLMIDSPCQAIKHSKKNYGSRFDLCLIDYFYLFSISANIFRY